MNSLLHFGCDHLRIKILLLELRYDVVVAFKIPVLAELEYVFQG